MFNVTEKMEKDCFEFGLLVIWAIWMSINAMVMNGDARDSYGTANFAASFYQEYKNAIRREEKTVCREKERWQVPPHGLIKLNFDGSLNVANRK